jgi:hypothetical protein
LEGQSSELVPWIAEGKVALTQIVIQWQDGKGHETTLPAHNLALPLLTSTDYSGLTEDPLVATRMGELDAADLQEQAHQAALMGDWDRVQVLLDALKSMSRDNAWTQSVVAELETLLEEGNRATFTKEVRFSSYTSSGRLAGKDETMDLDLPTSSYLRRKPRQGKPRKQDSEPED